MRTDVHNDQASRPLGLTCERIQPNLHPSLAIFWAQSRQPLTSTHDWFDRMLDGSTAGLASAHCLGREFQPWVRSSAPGCSTFGHNESYVVGARHLPDVNILLGVMDASADVLC